MLPSRPPLDHAKFLESFRGDPRAPAPLHPLEKALVAVGGLHLCFLPWAIGSQTPWAQVVSLCLGLGALIIALMPRRYDGALAPQGAFELRTAGRLLRFPPFWIGLLLLGYVACQALNPASVRIVVGAYRWLSPLEHVEWLPTGVKTPFELMNAWRMLCIWGGAWALACALWIGLSRRVALLWVLNILAINGALIAIIAILQKLTGATKILWFAHSVTPGFHGTFIYENHAGAYLNLMLAVSCGLALWHYARGLRRMERSTPAGIYVFLAALIASALLMSKSRASILLLIVFVTGALIVVAVWRLRRREDEGSSAITWLVAVVVAAFLCVATVSLKLRGGIEELQTLWTANDGVTLTLRDKAREATLEMFEANPVTGWGAGSFRHVFPAFQRKHPEIWRSGNNVLGWDHAHNDHAQLLAEVGLVGYGLILVGFLSCVWIFIARGGLAQPHLLLCLLGVCLTLAHAWMDFPLYNPAILTSLIVITVTALRWAEFEQERR